MFKLLHKNFLLPETFLLDSTDEASEIASNNPKKKYIVKPVYGSGGIGISWFDNNLEFDGDFLLQEYIEGNSISSSFLSFPDHSINMITSSDQIIGSKRLGGNDFVYCGNITPFINPSEKISNISSKISKMCKLVGSNGIDFVLKNNNVYVIEVNPRIQGTFECIENSFNMNLAEAHINACRNIPVEIPDVKQFTVKLIPYSFKQARYNLTDLPYLHDLSKRNYLFNKGDPIATIITSDRILENAMSKSERIQKLVYSSQKL